MPKLSIITINFNNLAGLQRTVESVVNQTWQEFEYIVIDGGSSDGSVAYLESHATNFDYWVSEPDSGIYNAMNKGIRKATGEYLLFLNSGDHLYSSNVLFENQELLKDKDLVYFDLNFVDNENSWVCKYPEQLLFSHFVKDTLPHPATFIKGTLFDEIGLYDENFKIVSDWKFFLLALFHFNCSYMRVNSVLSVYFLDGISSDIKNNEIIFKEREAVLHSNFKGFIGDMNQLFDLRNSIDVLRKSIKIKLLVKLGLINKF